MQTDRPRHALLLAAAALLIACTGCSLELTTGSTTRRAAIELFSEPQRDPEDATHLEIAPTQPSTGPMFVDAFPDHKFEYFFEPRCRRLSVMFVLEHESNWHDYTWRSIMDGIMWQQIHDPQTGRVYIERVSPPFAGFNWVTSKSKLTGRTGDEGWAFLSMQTAASQHETGWREIDGTLYQTHTYRGYMVVSKDDEVHNEPATQGGTDFYFDDEDGWAMVPVTLELCADLTARGWVDADQMQGGLAAVPADNDEVHNGVEITYEDEIPRVEGNDL